MEPIKFFKSEKDHFYEKIFRNIEKTPSKFKCINLTGDTNQVTELQYKFELKSISKKPFVTLNYMVTFFEKVVPLVVQEFHGLHNELKIK